MARPTTRRSQPRPGRTLILFLVGLVALYALAAVIGAHSKDDQGTWKPRLGLDLQGGTRITLQANDSSGDVTATKLEQARDIIDQRVNASGVSEAEVSTQGGNQVIIEIPGESRQNIVDEVGKTAQLRFRLLWAESASAQKSDPKAVAEARKVVDSVDWSKLSLQKMLAVETGGGAAALPKAYAKPYAALQTLAANFTCDEKGLGAVDDVADRPLVTCEPTQGGAVQILSPAVIDGTQIKSAQAGIPQQSVQWVVSTELKDQGTKTFAEVSKALVQTNSRFAIVLDGETISSPTMQAAITDGKSQISGNFTQTSAQALETQLKYGALPLTFEVNGVSVEGPSLAGTQLDAGLVAGVIGLLLVCAYSLLYYRGLGLVVISSLLVAGATTYVMVLLLGRGMGFTLTLPGIAGLIVAIGITADSFIVYFERLRDEVREGRSLRLAVESGWRRARTTILAADAVSFLAALVLFIFAIGVVRGFAFALGLTTLIDVAIVFLFTKPLVAVLARTKFFGQGHKLSGLDAGHLGIEGRSVTQIARTPRQKEAVR